MPRVPPSPSVRARAGGRRHQSSSDLRRRCRSPGRPGRPNRLPRCPHRRDRRSVPSRSRRALCRSRSQQPSLPGRSTGFCRIPTLRRWDRSEVQTMFPPRSPSRPAPRRFPRQGSTSRVLDVSRNVPVDCFFAASTPNDASRSSGGKPLTVTARPVIRPVDCTPPSVPASVASRAATPVAVEGSRLVGAPKSWASRMAAGRSAVRITMRPPIGDASQRPESRRMSAEALTSNTRLSRGAAFTCHLPS